MKLILPDGAFGIAYIQHENVFYRYLGHGKMTKAKRHDMRILNALFDRVRKEHAKS